MTDSDGFPSHDPLADAPVPSGDTAPSGSAAPSDSAALPDSAAPDSAALFDDAAEIGAAATIAEDILGLLRSRGPIDLETLAELVVSSAVGDPDATLAGFELALFDGRIAELADGRVAALDVLLAGRVLTHRLTADQIGAGVLPVDDVEPLLALASGLEGFEIVAADIEPELLAERGVAVDELQPDEMLLFPRGAFDGFRAGDLLAFAAGADGVTWGPVADEPEPSSALSRAVAEALRDREPSDLDAVVFGLVVDDPEVFTTPTLPLTELLAAAGYARSGNLVARDGFDFDGHLTLAAFDSYAEQVGVPVEAVPAVALFASLADALDAGDDADLEERFVEGCSGLYAEFADPDVAETVVDRLFDEGIGADALERAALWVRDRGPRRAAAAMSWIAGTAAEAAGRVDDAEALFGAAVDSDGGFDPALLASARYASDRGDAVRALSLLARASDERAAWLSESIEPFRPEERSGLGRNERCWCGSGRKYKSCHLGKADHPLEERGQWLLTKLLMHLDEREWVQWRYRLAEVRSGYSDDDDYVDAVAFGDPLVADVLLAEAGAAAQFLERRGHLLPADERELLTRWVSERRSLWEIDEVRPGEGLTVRDVRSGERREVAVSGLEDGNEGALVVCTRFLPVAGRWWHVGTAVGVPDESIDELAALLAVDAVDPVRLVAFLSGDTESGDAESGDTESRDAESRDAESGEVAPTADGV